MYFNLKFATGRFQREVYAILSSVKWQFAQAHLDDIVIISKSSELRIRSVRQALTVSNDAGYH